MQDFSRKPEWRSPFRRPWNRRNNNKIDLKESETGCDDVERIKLAQNRTQCQVRANTTINKMTDFFDIFHCLIFK